MKRILCFGDSNTWGFVPGMRTRFAPEIRWTGVAQKLLGEEYLIIEEGLNGRTTVYDNPCKPWVRGIDMLPGLLFSHGPLDLLIIMLGTNDLARTDAYASAEGIRALVDRAKELHKPNDFKPYPVFAKDVNILVVSPILMHGLLENHDGEHYRRAPEESKKFARLFSQVARETGADFMDAAQYAEPSAVDGVHMDETSHQRLGEAMAAKIREMLG